MASKIVERALVLVTAFPQPRSRYEEAVGCAGITPEGRFVRLYPWRFRALRPEQRFEMWDLIEYQTEHPADDRRPETRYIDARSIRVVRRAEEVTEEERMRLWVDHPCQPMDELKQANVVHGTSLAVIRPDEGSVQLRVRPLLHDGADERHMQDAYRQVAMIRDPAMAGLSVDFELSYRFRSAGHEHELKLHDWEAYATYFRYKRRYGAQALAKLKHKYERNFPARYLHLVVSTLKAQPREFVIVGLLRYGASLEEVTRVAA